TPAEPEPHTGGAGWWPSTPLLLRVKGAAGPTTSPDCCLGREAVARPSLAARPWGLQGVSLLRFGRAGARRYQLSLPSTLSGQDWRDEGACSQPGSRSRPHRP